MRILPIQNNQKNQASQPNFGKLKNIYMYGGFEDKTSKEALDVIKAFKESEAFTQFCKKYDVNATFKSNDYDYCYYIKQSIPPYASLKLEVNEKASGFFNKLKKHFKEPVIIKIEKFEDGITSDIAMRSLAIEINKTSNSDLENMYQKEVAKRGFIKQEQQKTQKEFDNTINTLLKD